MVMVAEWIGETACRLQAALRQSNERFARHVGVAPRTVATWHANPMIRPQSGVQQLLDRALHECDAATTARFEASGAAGAGATTVQPLRVAIAVVVKESAVLLVCRREGAGGISWQFPAGVVKPGGSAEAVAVRETLAETTVRCTVVKPLGSRVHPVTGALCDYFLADYLSGEPTNADVAENEDVVWTSTKDLGRYIPLERIYPPILDVLELN
jgi:8-oxo-dGTP diphosphatase